MGLISQVARTWGSCKFRQRDLKHTDVYKGLTMYHSFRRTKVNVVVGGA